MHTSDELDHSWETQEMITANTIQNIQAAATVREINPIGECHYCFKPFEDEHSNKLFCDSECSSHWEKLKK